MRLLGQFRVCLFTYLFLLRKDFKSTKTLIKQKSTNKTKLSEEKTIRATIFCAQKLLGG